MSYIENSILRRLIYTSPLLLITGIVLMFIDYEIGVPFLVAGTIGSIIFIISILRERREDPTSVFEERTVIKSQGKFCSECGKDLEDSVVFCKNCGIKL